MISLLLDLCSGSGAWSQPYRDAGWLVERIDIKLGIDVRDFEWINIPVRGIIASPPCTMFASSGARWERSDDDMHTALALVDACLRAVAIYEPHFWCLENPIGTLHRWIGPPKMYFDPNEYGDPYTKRTALWGKFKAPFKVDVVAATEGSKMHLMVPSPTRAAERAVTPAGFARAFYEVNQ